MQIAYNSREVNKEFFGAGCHRSICEFPTDGELNQQFLNCISKSVNCESSRSGENPEPTV